MKNLKIMLRLVRQAWRWTIRLIAGTFRIFISYRKALLYLLQHKGWKAVGSFIFVKYFARGERAGLQLLDPMEVIFPGLTPYPYMIEIETTTRCHLRCTICEHTYWPDPSYQTQDMSYDDFVKVMEQFPTLKYINMTGEGTSFANKDFIRMLEYLKSRNVYIVVIDSFTIITEQQLEKLVTLGVDKLVLSIDGATKDAYERVRVGGNFDTVLANVRKFVAIREKHRSPFPELCFRFIFLKDNYQDIPKYLELVDELRIRDPVGDDNHIEFTALLEFDPIQDKVIELPEEMIAQVDALAKRKKLRLAWSHPSHEAEKKRPVRECVAWAEPYIMIGGYALPCCAVMMSNKRDFLKKYSFGNVFQQDYKDIWYSERYRKFRKLVPRNSGPIPVMCAACRAFDTTYREKKYGVTKDI